MLKKKLRILTAFLLALIMLLTAPLSSLAKEVESSENPETQNLLPEKEPLITVQVVEEKPESNPTAEEIPTTGVSESADGDIAETAEEIPATGVSDSLDGDTAETAEEIPTTGVSDSLDGDIAEIAEAVPSTGVAEDEPTDGETADAGEDISADGPGDPDEAVVRKSEEETILDSESQDAFHRQILVEEGMVAVWDETKDVFRMDEGMNQTKALENDLDTTFMAYDEESGFLYPGLYVYSAQEDSAFTVTGSVEMTYAGEGADGVIGVLAESLPTFDEEETILNGEKAIVTIGDGITAAASSPADGDVATAYGLVAKSGDGPVIAVVDGDVTASASTTDEGGENPEYAFARAVEAYGAPDGEIDITVGGDAIASGSAKDGYGGAHGVGAYAGDGAIVNVHVEGNASAEGSGTFPPQPEPEEPEEPEEPNDPEDTDTTETSDPLNSRAAYSNTNAILIMTEDEGVAIVTVDGKAIASSNEPDITGSAADLDSTGLGSLSEAIIGEGAEGRISASAVHDGEVKVTVEDGGVSSVSGQEGAVMGTADHGLVDLQITGDVVAQDAEAHPGTAIGVNLTGKNEGTVSMEIDGSILASSEEDNPDAGVYADAMALGSDGGFVTAIVTEDVSSTATSDGEDRADATAIYAYARSENDQPGSVSIEVDGNVKAEASNRDGIAEALAITVSSTGDQNVVDLHVKGDVTAVAEPTEPDVTYQFGTRAIYASAMDGGEVNVIVDGEASAEGPDEYMMTKSVDVEAYGEGSSAFVQIGAGEGSVVVASTSGGTASVVVTDSGIEANFVGIDASAFDSDTSVSVVGDVVVGESASIPGKTYGAALSSDEDGNVELSVTGDITAQGEQGLAVGLAVGNADGTVEALVFGDVSAKGAEKNYGIDVYTAEDQKTNILVDGTVSGENAAVVLLQPETQIGENVSLTVWELVPDQNGATVLRQDDEEGAGLVEDEAAEKAVNYIIRINTDQQKIISLDGTTEVQGYDVAHEGEVVTLLLTVPEGYVITDAFADVAQNVSLSTDAAGNYFLTVPRGGGVELSVKLTEKKEDPATATLLGIRLVQRILTVDDQSGTIHLVFFSHGFYKVEFPDGSFENGTFSVKDGKIVLTSRSGNEMTIKNDGELTYAAEKLQNQIITFHLDDAALNVLKSNRT